MANISSYPSKTPKLGDIMIFSETYDVNAASPVVGNPTKSTSLSGIGAAISPTIATGTINTIAMFTTANKIGDSPIVFDGSSSTTVTGDLNALNDLTAGRDLNVTRTGYFGDLTVAGTTTSNSFYSTLDINLGRDVVAVRDGSFGNDVTVGNDLSVVNDVSIGNYLVVTGDTEVNALTINAALEDGSGIEGMPGQILSSTGSATQWIDVEAQAFSSLTTTGTSGAATLVAGVLNVPQYVSSAPAYTSSFMSISQSGTGEPTAAFLSNDAGLVLGTDTRMGTGEYYFTFTGTPPDEDNVMIVLPGGLRNGGYSFITLVSEYRNSGQLFINSYGVNGSGALIATDIGFGGNNSIIVEIRVFA